MIKGKSCAVVDEASVIFDQAPVAMFLDLALLPGCVTVFTTVLKGIQLALPV